MRTNIKSFTKEEVETLSTFIQEEVIKDNNDEIITTFLDIKNSVETAAGETDAAKVLHSVFGNENIVQDIKAFGDTIFLIKSLMLIAAQRDVLLKNPEAGLKFLSENFFTVEFDSINGFQRIILDDDAPTNYGLDLVYLNELGVAKLLIDGIRETEEFVDGLIALQCASNFKLFDGFAEQVLDNEDLRLSFARAVTTAVLEKKLGFVSGRHKDGTVDWGIAVVPDEGIHGYDPNDLLAIPIIDNSSYKTQHELHQQLGPERICNAIFESVVTNLFDTNNRKGALAFLDALGMKFNVIPKKVSEFETADDEDADESSMFSEI